MDTISVSDKTASRGYGSTQFRYAMTYVVITFVVLLFLNIYCSISCQKAFFESKKSAMTEKCLLAADEISTLDILNPTTVSAVVSQMENLTNTRLIVTDQSGLVLYDSREESVGTFALFPEIIKALDSFDVCSFRYRNAALDTRAATPIMYYGSVAGCVYMTDYDMTQGALIESLQRNILVITLLLEIIVTIFSIAFANLF